MNEINNFQNFWTKIHEELSKCNDDEMLVFRGHSKSTYKNVPLIWRGDKNESQIYKETLIKFPEEFNKNAHLSNLVKMRHYGVSTRLLDITTNPLVSLFFACSKNIKDDGNVIVFKIKKQDILTLNSDKALMLSCLPIFDNKVQEDIKESCMQNKDMIPVKKYKENNGALIKFLHEIRGEYPSFEKAIIGEDLLKSYVIFPQQDNKRIKSQSGGFIIFGLDKDETKKWDNKGTKIHIPAKIKESLLKDLNLMNINYDTLYGFCKHDTSSNDKIMQDKKKASYWREMSR